jgi:ABC-type taurine transport system substrate-binding protein
MASVETTTIRVRRSTHQRLQKEAELAGTSVTEVLEAAAELLEEQRMLDSFVRSYEKYGDEIRAEMKDWLNMPGPPLPGDDWSDPHAADDN